MYISKRIWKMGNAKLIKNVNIKSFSESHISLTSLLKREVPLGKRSLVESIIELTSSNSTRITVYHNGKNVICLSVYCLLHS